MMASSGLCGWSCRTKKLLNAVLLFVLLIPAGSSQTPPPSPPPSSSSPPSSPPSSSPSPSSSSPPPTTTPLTSPETSSTVTTVTTETTRTTLTSTPPQKTAHSSLPSTVTSTTTVGSITTPISSAPQNSTVSSINVSSSLPYPESSLPSTTDTTISTPYTTLHPLTASDSHTTNGTSTSTSAAAANTSTDISITSPATASTYPTAGTETTDQTDTYTTSTAAQNTTVATPIPCNFTQDCGDQSVYFWMMISVEVTGNLTDESHINEWLQTLFQQHLGECSSTANATSATPTSVPLTSTPPPSELSTLSDINTTATTSGNFSSTPDTQNVSTVTEVQFQNWTSVSSSVKENETATSPFQHVEVMCDEKTEIRKTLCTVLLQLSQVASPCCIARIVNIVEINSTIQGQVIGNQVQRVAKGICHGNDSASTAGNFEKCNGSLSVSCQSNATTNITCSGSSENVYVSLDAQDQTNCSSSYGNQTNYCYCSAYCNSTAAYYSLNIVGKNSSINVESLKLLIHNLFQKPQCNIINASVCSLWHNVSDIYQNSTAQCDINARCNVIVKLKHAIDVCSVRTALMSAFQLQSTMEMNGSVSRVAICSWENIPNLNFLQQGRVSVNLDASEFCMVTNLDSLLNYCTTGTNVAVILTENCPKIPVTVPSTTPSPSSTTAVSSASTTVTVTSTTDNNTTTLQKSTTPSVTTVANITSNTTTLNTTVPGVPNIPTSTATTVTTITVNTTASTTSSASAELAAEGLLNQSKNVSALNSTQVENLVSQLEQLLSGPNVSLALGNTTVNIVSNLLDAPSQALGTSSNRIIGLVDTVGLKLVVQGQSQSILSPALALAVKTVGAEFQQTTFTMTDSSNLQIGGSMSRRSVDTTVLPPQGSIILPSSLLSTLTPQQQQMVSRVQFNFYQKSTLFRDSALDPNETTLISGVLGSSVANLSISNLKENVTITLRNTEPVSGNYTPSCVFWDFHLNGGLGGWSSEGCTVLNSTENETVCACNHLTSFGVLLDISGEGITNRLQATILTYITYIGCGISAIFLSITLLTYLSFEKLRKDIPSKILIQLCFALLLLNLVFLLDSWLALYPDAVGLCISTAFFLHYFLLASFTWMALEAVQMYFALVKVFNTYISRFMLKLGLAGWGIPLVVVIIVIAIDKNNYGLVSYGKFEDGTTDEFCWLKNSVAFYVAVVAYFCVVFLLNLSMFIVVMVQLCRIKRQNPHNVQNRSGFQDLRSVAGLTVLLGLTWGFAFFAWGPVNLAFMYLFAIFNSLQGFFIFVFHCAVKENVRRQWRIYLCCGKFRLAENSDWSHTATQKTKKSSVNRIGSSSVKSSNSNNLSSSTTFLVSNSPGSGSRSGSERSLGISSPFDDRTITAQEDTSSDVVLNEIHQRYRDQRSY
ncbi:adhesion G-protein coupled receptor G2 isoform X1 [Astyanax mexicanus]|uniref:adhesion G-protein coupled receptor G2 isoform X1 n=1 Tax=Astyanax mexicanus TaxID=7994 RepID=UPI0020CAD28C|nr:adhesion G-protein coupled receptor G2 isoform X1 [Astyanax mexicanus]